MMIYHEYKLKSSGNDMPELNEEETPRRGYKGMSVMDTGYIYAPVFTTASTNSWGNEWTSGGSSSSYSYGGSSTTTCGSGTSSTGTFVTDYGWKCK
jgi:hypothetical protein